MAKQEAKGNEKKKAAMLRILKILEDYTDYEHRISIQEIEELLVSKYEIELKRKAIKRNLEELCDMGYDIEYEISYRKGKNGEEEEVKKDWYLQHTFDDSELRLIIETVLFSRYIPHAQKTGENGLIKRLEGLSSQYFRKKVRHVNTITDISLDSADMLPTIEVLAEAIHNEKQVCFNYNFYDIDKKKHSYKNTKKLPREYIISPYYIVSANNRYYLICNHKNNDELQNYRLDRMSNIAVVNERRRPITALKGLKAGLDLTKYMTERLYMFSGEVAPVRFRVKRMYVDDVIDWFGKDVHFSEIGANEVTVRAKVNLNAMKIWAVQYGTNVRVLSPPRLVDEVKETLKQALSKYEENV